MGEKLSKRPPPRKLSNEDSEVAVQKGRGKRERELPRIPLDQEIREFEEAAEEMLSRMDTMLSTVREINSEVDPGKRLEVRTTLTVGYFHQTG